MPVLELRNDQAAVLEEYLQRVLSELSVEIAGTDSHDFREQIKAERQLLREIVERLRGFHRSVEWTRRGTPH